MNFQACVLLERADLTWLPNKANCYSTYSTRSEHFGQLLSCYSVTRVGLLAFLLSALPLLRSLVKAAGGFAGSPGDSWGKRGFRGKVEGGMKCQLKGMKVFAHSVGKEITNTLTIWIKPWVCWVSPYNKPKPNGNKEASSELTF